MIELIVVSFLAGILTVLAPCILPVLPIIIGGSLIGGNDQKAYRLSLKRPLIIISSLAVSIFVFTLLLKATTTFLGIPDTVWHIIAGGIITLFGVNILAPSVWEKLMIASNLQLKANQLMSASQGKKGVAGDILLGAALGPVFNSCSPTYALIVATILPVSFGLGLVYLLAYVAGLVSVLLLISIFGQSLTRKLGWLANPKGWFIRAIGIVFIVVGLCVMFSFDKKIQSYVLENGWYDPIMQIEKSFDL